MDEFLRKKLKSNKNSKYEILFMISSVLYSSTLYFTVNNPCLKNRDFQFTYLTDFKKELLQVLMITMSALFLCLILIDIWIRNIENYLIQIMEKIIFPFQIFICAITLNQKSSECQENRKLFSTNLDIAFFLAFVLTTISIILKNLKFSLRYSHTEKGLKRILSEEYFFLLTKILVNLIFSMYYPNQLFVYVWLVSTLNLLSNVNFVLGPVYEHSNIEFLYMLTQIYQWVPIVSLMMGHAEIGLSIGLIFNLCALAGYFSIGLFKPSMFVTILQEKYLRILLKLQKQINNSKYLQYSEFRQNLTSILGLYMEVLFRSSNDSQKLKWSQSFKIQLVGFLQTQVLKSRNQTPQKNVHEANNVSSINLFAYSETSELPKGCRTKFTAKDSNIEAETLNSIHHSDCFFRNQFRNRYRNLFSKEEIQDQDREEKNSVKSNNSYFQQSLIFFQKLVWDLLVHPFVNNKNSNFNEFRFYVCYNFPAFTQMTKLRLFQCYYQSPFKQFQVPQQTSAKICHNFLLQKIGAHQMPFFKKVQSYDVETKQSPFCLFPENTFYNTKFNQILQEESIMKELVTQLEKFLKNEKHFLQIFKNVKENKENITKYYKIRRQVRRKVIESIEQFQNIKIGNSFALILSRFIKDYFLDKNSHEAFRDLSMYLEKLTITRKFSSLSVEKTQTKIIRPINSKIIDSLKTRYDQQNSPESIHCVISVLSQPGQIRQSSQTFSTLLELQDQHSQLFTGRNKSHHLHKFYISPWRDQNRYYLHQLQLAQYVLPQLHSTNETYLLSNKGTTLITAKYQMFFFMKYEKDLMIVMDFIQWENIIRLKVEDENKKVVFEFTSKKHFSSSRLNPVCKEVQLLGKTFHVQQTKSKISEKSQSDRNHSKIQDTETKITLKKVTTLQERQSNTLLTGTNNDDLSKYLMFKQSFQVYPRLKWSISFSSLIVSFIFVTTVYNRWLQSEAQNKASLLKLIKDKMFIQNKYISYDEMNTVDVGLLYNLVLDGDKVFGQGKEEEQQQFLRQALISIELMKKQMMKKYQYKNFNEDGSVFSDILYDSSLTEGNDHSFFMHFLVKQTVYFENLKRFVDFDVLDEFDILSKPPPSPLQPPSNRFPTISLPQSISPMLQFLMSKYLSLVIITKSYNYGKNGKNGIISIISQMENLIIQKMQTERWFYFTFLVAGFLGFTLVLIYFAISINTVVLDNLNLALMVSDGFLKKFASQVNQLQIFMNRLDKNAKEVLSIQQSDFKEQQISSAFQQILQTTQKIVKHQNNHKFSKKYEQRVQSSKLDRIRPIFKSISIPIFRCLAVISMLSYTLFLFNGQRSVFQHYSKVITQISSMSANMAQSYAMTLYFKKVAKETYQIQATKSVFSQCISSIHQVDKIKMVKNMFPYDEKISHSIMYEPVADSLQLLNLSTRRYQDLNSFFEEQSSLIYNFQNLFSNAVNPRHGIKSRMLETFSKIDKFVSLIYTWSDKSAQILEEHMIGQIFGWIEIGMIFFLVIETTSGLAYFWNMFRGIQEELLNIGQVEYLAKESGFDQILNRAKYMEQLPDPNIQTFQRRKDNFS